MGASRRIESHPGGSHAVVTLLHHTSQSHSHTPIASGPHSSGCPQWTLSSPPVFDSKAAEGSSTLWSGDSFRIREEKIFLKVYNICYNACDPVWRLFDVFAVQAGINLVSIDQWSGEIKYCVLIMSSVHCVQQQRGVYKYYCRRYEWEEQMGTIWPLTIQ